MHNHAMSIIYNGSEALDLAAKIGNLHQQSLEQLLGHLAKAVFAGLFFWHWDIYIC
jgi:hypothetical protein